MSEYIYILINPSLKGMLKIGKTNRSPEERAIELSNNTNMPTPFVVAYEEQVPDSSLAERLIHEELQKQGLRINGGREFFSIPLKDAIRVTASIAECLRQTISNEAKTFNETERAEATSGAYFLNKGLDAYAGTENTLQDYSLARDHFEKALALGENKACFWLGMLYLSGNGVRQSTDQSLKFLRQGGESGDIECFRQMWQIYSGHMLADDSINHNNAEICFGWYFDKCKKNIPIDAAIEYLEHFHDTFAQSGCEKFALSSFPGKYSSKIIDTLSARVRNGVKKIRHARIIEIPIDEREELANATMDLVLFEAFLDEKTADGHLLLRDVMAGIEKEDIEYCFANAKDPKSTVARYRRYLSTPENCVSVVTAESSAGRPKGPISAFFRKFLT